MLAAMHKALALFPIPALALSLITALAVLTLGACAHAPKSDPQLARPAVVALQEGRFDEASEQARTAITKDANNGWVRAVLAVTRYKSSGEQALHGVESLIEGAFRDHPENLPRLRQTVVDLEAALGRVDEDLAIASREQAFSIELCLACWQVDWNHNGRLDRRDARLFQIEVDGNGESIPDEDPRRKPTFRFDVGDLHWARAMVAFQRGLLDLLLVYWSPTLNPQQIKTGVFTLKAHDRPRSVAAKQRFLDALDQSEAARTAYLAETDDDREWVPSPRQKNHPMPLPVDEKLYQTWAALITDVRAMLKGQEAIELQALVAMIDPRGRAPRPSGYVNLGAWLASPPDIEVNPMVLGRVEREPELLFRTVFGPGYVTTGKASPILTHLSRMSEEIKRGEESFEKKLRYLFWIN